MLGGAGSAIVGPETARWLVAGLSKISEHTIFGPMTPGSQAEFALTIGAGLSLVIMHYVQKIVAYSDRHNSAPPVISP